ncbi:hypothetical protein FHS15_002262 [Paenibacillus castaneae]|uniref:S-layer homology domain-containing protein n=1 Tax=Paenibacillus castaneae TaxID=474957 RepID=UPI00141AB842|nr:S-layer homology domain-containing protein [Paenibacillus castaneae]NIK77137.1 hypothetical protein [Paenibacillus castaneae]
MVIKGRYKQWISIMVISCLLLGIVPMSFAEGAVGDGENQSVQSSVYDASAQAFAFIEGNSEAPPLLITEMVPDTNNVNGADAYEFVEVYNNTSKPINFNEDYYFYYNNANKWSMTNASDQVVIPAGEAIVFWIMNGFNAELTEEQFVANLPSTASLKEGVNLFRLNGGAGMANTASRNLQIKDRSTDSLIVSATYEAKHVKLNMGIFFKLPTEGSKVMTVISPESGTLPATPGVVTPEQIASSTKPVLQPEIIHTPPQKVDAADYEVVAAVKNLTSVEGEALPPVELLYKTPAQARYTAVTMLPKQDDEYTAIIPMAAFVESKLEYKIRVKNTVKTYTIQVNIPEFESEKAPLLLITELLPNSTNVKGTSADAYEFIEVYNNTNQPINFKNYKIYYRYPDKGPSADVKWASTKDSFFIPAQQSVVFWIKNSSNDDYKVEDFNTFFNTNFIENEHLFIIKSDGMANSGRRAVVIKTNTEKEISAAYYDADTTYDGGVKGDETKEDRGIQYNYPVSGSTTMIKASSSLSIATPGMIDPSQVPAVPVPVIQDTIEPTVEDLTGITQIDQSNSLDLKAFANDDKEITSVEVFIRSDKQLAFVSHNLAQDYSDSLYHYKLSSADLIGRSYIEYYFSASDGMNVVETPKYKVEITGGPDQSELRLNVTDGDILSGAAIVKGTSQNAASSALTLSIDDKQLAGDTFPALENDAYFVFDAKNVDYYFKNGITMGPPELGDASILYTFMDPIPTYTTLSFPISSARLQLGEDNVIYIRAGSKSSPFDPRPEENKDDFEIRNVRLLLADGTEIWDPLYAERDKEIKMGDSTGKHEWIGFKFNLDSEMLKSKAYQWNTTEVTDGIHLIKVNDGLKEVTAEITVDNTAPSIKASVEEGKLYRGHFEINAEIKDTYAGVSQVEAKLDQQVIRLPYAVSSGMLAAGSHTLFIKATDKVGNAAETTITFQVPDENPFKPELVAPINGESSVSNSPTLTVKVDDPTGDALDVSFLKGFKYDSNRSEGFIGFMNASDTEPPKVMIPRGEHALTAEDYSKISAADGQYLTNDSVEQFPYQRYEIKLDPTIQATDQIAIEWKGKSLEGRKVSLYVWSVKTGKWEQLTHQIAGDEDFELKSVVTAGDYADEGTIQILIQDEIAAAALSASPVTEDRYYFSFVWMSDTQYYSQSYPYIYQKNVKWIADNKDKINLQYVIHTGDVVDKEYQEYQWLEADKDMKVLEDANIPYGVLAGNHDVGHQNNDYTKFSQYFGDWRFKDMPTFGGSYMNNRGHYDLVSAGGNDFIIVYMGWGLADAEIDWMNEIVSQYPERKAILALHEYMLVSNNRAPIADKIYEKVVVPNKNVFATLSGHYHDAQLKIDELDDDGDGKNDRKVYQILADYQGAPEGGLGYIRLMQFDIQNNKLHMKTYSPYLDQYNYYDPIEHPGKDEFSLDLDLQPKTKRVATDYIGVKVYTDQLIGKQSNVSSGTLASVNWSNLADNAFHQWYVIVEDANSGRSMSDIWGFHTGTDSGAGEKPTPSPDPTPTPVPTPITDKGIIQLEIGMNGENLVERSILDQAMKQSVDGKVGIHIKGSVSDTKNVKLSLDAAGLQDLKTRKLTLEIVTPALTVTVPAASLPDGIDNADKVIIELNSLSETVSNGGIGAGSELTSLGLVYDLKFSKVKAQKESIVQKLDGPITIVLTLSDEQLSKIDSDYAGIYELNDGKAIYLGGRSAGNRITFDINGLSPFAVMEYHKSFADIKGNWAEPFIQKLAAKHIISGIDLDNYGPKQNVSRADFATLVIRTLGLKELEEGAVSKFTDVSEGAYYTGYVAKAAELGLIQGSDGKFRPKDTVTREEAAVIIDRMAVYMDKSKKDLSASPSFADMIHVSPWAQEAVNHSKTLGIINGKGDNRFDPQGQVTRAEIAKMLYQILNIS